MSLKIRNWDFNLRAEASKIARSKSVMPADPSSGLGQPGSSNSLDRPLKTGWLKKQRSIVKNWQLKYFVLKGQNLYYYKDDKDSTCQGYIALQSSQINELPSNADDPSKFLFEIIPGGFGDRERDSHILMANSQNEMEEWVKTIRRMIGAPSSGAVFGQNLADTLLYEQKFGHQSVPILVEKCAEFIREHGLSEEGIFRLPGQDNQVKQFRDAFDAGERPSFPSDTDVHTVASLFKLYLRELPQPVVPWCQYEDFLDCSQLLSTNQELGRVKIEKQISLLPRANYKLLSYICRFLYEIQLNSGVNKMSVENLATVIGVNLLKPRIEDPVTIMKGTPQIQKLMTVMISLHNELFPKSKDVAPSPPPQKSDNKKSNIPRSSVGWDVTEGPTDSAKDDISESRSLSESAEDVARLLDSDGLELEGANSLTSPCTDPWTGSPRKRTQTLPSRTSSFGGEGSRKNGSGKRAGLLEANLWGQPGSSPLESDSEKGTLSEDIFKILDLQRVSLYPSLRKTSERADSKALEATSAQVEVLQPRELQRSETEKEQKATTVQSREQEDNGSQKVYEDQINSLQKRNNELSATVAELRASLEVEKRRNTALEIRLRNADRAREEAEKRNQILDCEIQQFLSREKATAGPS
ncbi:rho GTPase-activating protein 25 [Lepisosteus oculatus]|uniref:rho GTPase-activating protein 25 n=1 Tax=Lepisosteus oculatus TaxID=7918 RepID=UPI0035F51133